MGFFTGDDKDLEMPAEYFEAMRELLKRGKAKVSYPTQAVAGLSKQQQDALKLGEKYYKSGTDPLSKEAVGVYRDFTGYKDVMDRPEVKGMIGKATETGNLMLNRAARSIGMRQPGTSSGTPGRDILGRGVTAVQEYIASALGDYMNAAENRKLAAGGAISGEGTKRETSQVSKVGVAADLGTMTRNIAQQIEDAKYQKLINDINMRYSTQPQLLANVMGQSVGAVTGGGPSDFAGIASGVGNLLTGGANLKKAFS